MTNYCNDLITKYITELKAGFQIVDTDTHCIIITPFLDPSGDHIEIKAMMDGKRLILSDNGDTFDYLFINGLDLTDNRKRLITFSLNNNNAFLIDNSEISVKVKDTDDIGSAIHRLIRAINSIQHLTYTSRPTGIRTFNEEVSSFFVQHDVSFHSLYILPGKSKEHKFDFYIPEKANEIAIAIKTLSTEQPGYAKRLAAEAAFTFVDIQRKNIKVRSVSLVDDRNDVWIGEAVEILRNYSEYYIVWSKNEDLLNLVA